MATNDRGALYAFVVLFFIAIPSSLAGMISPALPEIQAALALDEARVSWLVGAYMAGFVLGQLIYPPISNRYGCTNALQAGLVVNLLGSAAVLAGMFGEVYAVLFVGRLISAFGAAAGLVCTIIIINQQNPVATARRLLSHSVTAFVVSIYAGMVLVGFTVTHLGWENSAVVMLVYSAIALLMSVVLKRFTAGASALAPKLDTSAAPGILGGYLVALSNLTLVRYSIILAMSTVISYTFTASAPLIADKLIGLDASAFSLWSLANAIGTFTGGLVSARMVRSLEGDRVIAVGLVIVVGAIMWLIAMYALGIYSTITFFAATGCLFFAQGLIFPSASHYASTALADGANAAGMMSFLNMFIGFVAVVGSSFFIGFGVFPTYTGCLAFFALLSVALLAGRAPKFVVALF